VLEECLLRRLGQFGELGVGGALSFDDGLVCDGRDGGDCFDGHGCGRLMGLSFDGRVLQWYSKRDGSHKNVKIVRVHAPPH
jgi:hypothetical protein